MPSLEQFVCWAIGLLLIVAAFRYLVKEKLSFSFVLCLCAIAFFFFGLSGVQGLLKTGLILTVKDSLVQYGEKLDGFQTNVWAMRSQLNVHQTQIDEHQKELNDQQAKIRITQLNLAAQEENITNQYQQISALQGKLTSAQTNIDQQENQLQDVTYWVDHLYSNMTNETFSLTDTNRVVIKNDTNGFSCVCFKLAYTPIRQSVQGLYLSGGGLNIPIPMDQPAISYGNLLFQDIVGFDLNSTRLQLQYVRDTRRTNLVANIGRIKFIGSGAVVDDKLIAVFSATNIKVLKDDARW